MIEKVNPAHPDKVADRIAGAIVDIAYDTQKDPKIAVEVLIGHGCCNIIIESSVVFSESEIKATVWRIVGEPDSESLDVRIKQVPQDPKLAKNQSEKLRCGDNGIFKGSPITEEQRRLSEIARAIYAITGRDGKYILDGEKLIICQSNIETEILCELYPEATVNPLGNWEGGISVDCGCTNRKIGSDMADAVTGGGLHGKDLSKADVSVNIYAYLKAQESGEEVKLCCAIGDESIDGVPYGEIVETARKYIQQIGGFEKFAEWGLF